MITLSDYFKTDHQKLDFLLTQFISQLNEAPLRAETLFQAFTKGLCTHIQWEENALFPFFESRLKMSTVPTDLMREEHQKILSFVYEIETMLKHDTNKLHALCISLKQLLDSHNLKEERIIYPLLDQHCTHTDKSNLFTLMEIGQIA